MRALIAALLVSVAGVAHADTVWLKNGGKLEDVTTSIEGDKLVVKTQAGTVKFDRADVSKVVHRASKMEEYEIAAAKVKKDDAKAHFELAKWCGDNELGRYERIELEATLAADPEHAEARKKLGYEKVGKDWLRGEALLLARGMVKVEGKWMTKEGAAAMAAEKERARLDRAIAAAKAKAAREERESEADRLREFTGTERGYRDDDFDRRRAPRSHPRGYRDYYSDPWSYGGGLYIGTYGYGYSGYGGYRGYGYGYRPSIGFSYKHGNTSIKFGTSHYGYGYGYPGSYGYSSGGFFSTPYYGPVGGYVPGGSSANPGYFRSSGSFDRGGNPHFGGAR